jgi:hypothetical protein
VTEKQLAKLQAVFPDWNFSFGDGMYHPHVMGATERAICEELALRDIYRNFGKVSVTDIGGNANRHFVNKRKHVHSCNPVLDGVDSCRHNLYKDGANYCTSLAQDCTIVPDVYLSVHSLYYLPLEDIVDLVYRSTRKCLVAVVHRFEELYGQYHDNGDFVESKYQVFINGDEPYVHMKVNGNLTGYSHSAMLWLGSGYAYSDRPIAWNGYPVGDSWILTFVPSVLSVPKTQIDLTLVESISRSDHVGGVKGIISSNDETEFKPMLDFINISDARIKSFGPFIWFDNKIRVSLIPKSLISHVAYRMVGKARDKAGLQLCINTMRKFVDTNKMSIPDDMRIDCVTFGAAAAFVLSLDKEILAFNKLCERKQRNLYYHLNSVLALESRYKVAILNFIVVNSYWLCGMFGVCLATGYVWPSVFILSLMLLYTRKNNGSNLTVDMYNAERVSVASEPFDARARWPRGLEGVESNMQLKERKSGSTISGVVREPTEPRPQFYANCFTFQEHIPVVPYASKNNEVVAINNRALMQTPKPNMKLWGEVNEFARKHVLINVECIDNRNLDLDFYEWNSRFPDARKLHQLEAYRSLQETRLNKSDFVRKMFVKRELTLKSGPEYNDFDPRAIQGDSHRLNAALGPFAFKLSKQLNKIWNIGNRITYTAGLTAEQIGAWRSQFGEDPVTLIEIDQSRYDAHQNAGSYLLNREWAKHAGVEEYGDASFALLALDQVYGRSSKGVKYSVDKTMTSGIPVTSCFNTYCNGNTIDFILHKFDVTIRAYIIVHGDDSLVVIRGKMNPWVIKRLQSYIVDMYKQLGFKAKVKIRYNWYEVEYCSSLFWPVEGGYVLGPKIGKRLPKLGFNLRVLKPEMVKGMLIGAKLEMNYIPVLRMYVDRALSRLQCSVAKYNDPRAIYKSLPTSLHVASIDTEVFFNERYGYSVQLAEEEFSKSLNSARTLTHCVSYPLLSEFMAVDLQD